MRLKGSSPASVVRCQKLVFWRRGGGADSTRVHPHGASAKRRRSDASVAAPVNLVPEQRARAILDQVALKSEGNLVVPMYLEPSSPLLGAAEGQDEGVLIIFLLVVDGCDGKGCQIAEAYVIRTVCTLPPCSQFLLSPLLA